MTVATVSEAEYQSAIVDLAHLFSYTVAHFRPARTAHGWRTPAGVDGVGWPDLFMVKPGRAIAAELKSRTGKVGVDQAEWLARLAAAGVEAYVWREGVDSYEAIAAVLRTPVGGVTSASA